MKLDGPLADEQLAGDLRVLPAASQEGEHLEFSGRETVRSFAFVAVLLSPVRSIERVPEPVEEPVPQDVVPEAPIAAPFSTPEEP